MTRDEAFELVKSRLGESATLAHCLASEACMRALAQKFGQDVELWGLSGLVHDLDLNECSGDMERHALIGAEVLRENNVAEAVVLAVLGHNDKAERKELMDKALWVVDPTTGLITAAALIRPSKSTSDLKVKSIKKRMKDKRFAAAVNRDQIRACETELGLELNEFLTICLNAMDSVRDSIGL
ncbi:MAG: HDIG domain-containing protein [Proteobacteria bacterium]|nr:HDIG domain-containing protein [Pseudomonadota bacterium]